MMRPMAMLGFDFDVYTQPNIEWFQIRHGAEELDMINRICRREWCNF